MSNTLLGGVCVSDNYTDPGGCGAGIEWAGCSLDPPLKLMQLAV